MYLMCKSDYRVIEDTYGCDGDYTGFNHDEYSNHHFYLSENQSDYGEFQCVVDPNNCKYVLAVIYSTGGTFGRTDGCVQVIKVSNDLSDLEFIAKTIKDKTYGKDVNCKKCKKGLCFTHGLNPWEGYFESLQDIIIQGLDIESYRKSYL